MMDSMSPRERVLRTLRHQPVDRLVITLDTGGGLGIDGPYRKVMQEQTGRTDPDEFFDYDIRVVEAPLTPQAADFSIYHQDLPPDVTFDAFGVGRVESDMFALGMHISPWKSFTTLEQMKDYPFPTFEIQGETAAQIRALQDRGYAVSVACGAINEWCYYVRSMALFLEDLALNPELAGYLLDQVTALAASVGEQLANAGTDIVCFYGDVGGQKNMLMSPRMWRKWIKPRWQHIFERVRRANPRAAIFFHSCGYIEPIIPDMVEIGLNILNPIQPEAMDPIAIKRQYGDQVTLWGGIGLQTTMLADNEDTVRKATRSLIDAWAVGSGAIPTIANSLPVDVPWRNVVTLLDTVREYGSEVCSRLNRG